MSKHKYKIYFLVRSYKSFKYFDRCIDSIFQQKHKQYTIIFIDDDSDYTTKNKKHIRDKLKKHIVVFNKTRKFSLKNAYEAIHKFIPDNAIIFNVDGDDWLIGINVIETVLKTYIETKCDFTYGNCLYFNPGKIDHNKTPLETTKEINRKFPKKIEINNKYRLYHFLPLHLRTWKASLFKKLKKENFLRPDGSWIKFCEDQAIYYPMLEITKGNYQVINKPLYCYNLESSINDNKVNNSERLLDEVCIRKK